MQRIEVAKPSFISAYRYDEIAKSLTIEFRDGRKWTHANVPESLYKQFSESPHPFGFWARGIRQATGADQGNKSHPVVRVDAN